MKPDLSTIRPVPWLEATALVLCDVLDHHTKKAVSHSPRLWCRLLRQLSGLLPLASYGAYKGHR